MVPTPWAPIKYSCSDRIVTWSTCKLCSFLRCFAFRDQISDPTSIHGIPVNYRPIERQIRGLLIMTQRLLVRSQFCQREVKERLKLHNLHVDDLMIRSELRYIIGAKLVVMKCGVFGGKTSPIPTGQIVV